MPQVNLSTLNGQELRQLLDSSRRRGDAALSYTVLQEMAARREAGGERRPFMLRRPAEPRHVDVELDEAAETDDDLPPLPNWRPPVRDAEAVGGASPPPAPQAPAERRSRRKTPPPPQPPASKAAAPVAALDLESPPPLETHRPLSLWHADAEPPRDDAADAEDPGLRMHLEDKPGRSAPRPPRLGLVAGLALGIPIGLALGWWGAVLVRNAPSSPTAPAAAQVQTAALTPAPASPETPPAPSASAAEPAPEVQPAPPAAPPGPDLRAAPITPPDAQGPARAPDAAATESPAPASRSAEADSAADTAPPALERPARGGARACAGAATPADRTICGDPKLQLLQGELRQAYAAALAAHQDRTLLRQRQLAWRDARNSVSDPDRLARLYEERIRKLNAATAAARHAR